MKPSSQIVLGIIIGVTAAMLLSLFWDAMEPQTGSDPAEEGSSEGSEPASDMAPSDVTDAPADQAVAPGRVAARWSFEPAELQVYRSTAVHFRVSNMPVGHPDATCSWNFGDGSPTEQGCALSHTFHGGVSDQIVTLTLVDGSWESSSTQTVPIERLEVVEGLLDDPAGVGGSVPPVTEPGPASFRMAFIADSAAVGGVPEVVQTAVAALERSLAPELVVHLGGLVPPVGEPEDWKRVRQRLASPLMDAGVRLAWSVSPTDRLQTGDFPRSDLQMVDDQGYPRRYSFIFKGSYFMVVSAVESGALTEETLDWMRDELSSARVYDARFVVSYLPLHKFGDEHLGSLDKKFRLYEIFLRGRVTTLFSAGYRVYFKGRYGALPVVSVGALAEPGGRLAGHEFMQPGSLVLVDIIKGVPERIFAVEGPSFDRTLDEALLPDTVEVYTR